MTQKISHITKEEWKNVKKEYENPPYENPEVLKNRVERVSEVFAGFEFELFESVGLNDLLNFIHNGDSALFEGETADLQTALMSLGNGSKEEQKFIKVLEKTSRIVGFEQNRSMGGLLLEHLRLLAAIVSEDKDKDLQFGRLEVLNKTLREKDSCIYDFCISAKNSSALLEQILTEKPECERGDARGRKIIETSKNRLKDCIHKFLEML